VAELNDELNESVGVCNYTDDVLMQSGKQPNKLSIEMRQLKELNMNFLRDSIS
jgi:hypothetical protein